jgi:PilZ domain
MNDKRHNARTRVLKAGEMEFGGGAIDCVARNISAHGAALDVESPVGIPGHFRLVIGHDVHACAIKWRKEKRIGVVFE